MPLDTSTLPEILIGCPCEEKPDACPHSPQLRCRSALAVCCLMLSSPQTREGLEQSIFPSSQPRPKMGPTQSPRTLFTNTAAWQPGATPHPNQGRGWSGSAENNAWGTNGVGSYSYRSLGPRGHGATATGTLRVGSQDHLWGGARAAAGTKGPFPPLPPPTPQPTSVRM